MRAFNVSVRMRRLPVNRMRSITVPGCCAGGSWNEGGREPYETFAASARPEEEEELEDRCSAALELFCARAGTAEATKKIAAAIHSLRTRKIPNGKETLVRAAA